MKILSDHYITLSSDTRPHEGEWVALYTPETVFHKTSCLVFHYFTRYMQINVKAFNLSRTVNLMDISYDGQTKYWHYAEVDLKPGIYRLVFLLTYGSKIVDDIVGIDNITVTPSHCVKQSTYSELLVKNYNSFIVCFLVLYNAL